MRILYLDDNDINRMIVNRFLNKHHQIDCVETVEEAIEKVNETTYELILIDINLNNPDIDGFGVLNLMKEREDLKHTKFYAHTNYIGEEWEKRCRMAGFNGYIAKPFDVTLFNNLVA